MILIRLEMCVKNTKLYLYSAILYLIINPIYVMRYHGINKNYQAMIRSFHVPIRKLSECSNF